MQISITGQHVEVTDPLRSYVDEKIGRIHRHFDHVTSTNVVLLVEKNRHLAECTIHTKGAQIHANADGDDMYAAIDFLADKLDRQVIKHKEKTGDHHQRVAAEQKHQY
ncbi:MAG: ribosome-associated translation inhibitor RaiA [Acidiferrobacteraceae bacterium]|jgi:putative sigma-54 modulation protein